MRFSAHCLIAALAVVLVGAQARCQQAASTPAATQQAYGTQLVMLGTGTPLPDPARSGPAQAVVVNGTPYLIDCGPGVVRRMAEARRRGVAGAAPTAVRTLFITHLHSDHTVGYPDIIFTPAVVGRAGALEVYGPAGLSDMTSA